MANGTVWYDSVANNFKAWISGVLTILPIGSGSGDVVGPAVAVNDDVALFNGTTGKLIKDSGIPINTVARTTEDFLTSSNESATLPNSRQLIAGANISFNDSVANQRTISATDTDTGIIQLTGNVTAGPGSGSQVATIANDAVSFAKMQNINTDRLLGRDTAAAGDVEEISVSGGIEFNGGPGIQRSALTGDVTAPAGNNATTIANDAVTDAKLRNSAALSVIGRAANSVGDPADIVASADNRFLKRVSSTLAFSQVDLATGDITGILPDGNLSSNIPLKNGINVFTNTNQLGRLTQLNGATSAFPAFRRAGQVIEFVLADESAYARQIAASIGVTEYIDLQGGQLSFPATQNPSSDPNTLDDYEGVGNWTPADGSGAGLTLTVSSAKYVKIGRQVSISFDIAYPITANGANALITGIPFVAGGAAGLSIGFQNGAATYTLYIRSGTTQIELYNIATRITNAQLSGSSIVVSGTYFV